MKKQHYFPYLLMYTLENETEDISMHQFSSSSSDEDFNRMNDIGEQQLIYIITIEFNN